jgi:hypothetical protein
MMRKEEEPTLSDWLSPEPLFVAAARFELATFWL